MTNGVSALHLCSLLTFASISHSLLCPNRVGSALWRRHCQPRWDEIKKRRMMDGVHVKIVFGGVSECNERPFAPLNGANNFDVSVRKR